MSWGDKKNFCDLTDPHWVCLGTHRHPWVLPNRYLQRANFVVFWAISRISKVNNTFSQPSRGRPVRADRGEAHLNDVRFNSN